MPTNLSFLIRFRGIESDERLNTTFRGAYSQIGAAAYLVVMELLCILMTKFMNDAVVPCKLAFVLFALAMISGVIWIITTESRLRRHGVRR